MGDPMKSIEAAADTGGLTRREALLASGSAGAALGGLVVDTPAAATGRLPWVVRLDAVELSKAIRHRRVSCREVMVEYLDHIDRINPRVNAIVSLQDRAGLIAQAQERDRQLARGEYLGFMHGFPHAVKDLGNTAGIRTTLGSPIFADNVPTTDAIFVERLKRAGAIIIGKTNTPEFGLGSQTYNTVFGTTLNAYDQTRTAAAAAAARPWPWRCGWCRSPTAATTWARCATRPPGTTSSASGPRPGASRPVPPARCSPRTRDTTVRWAAR